MREITWARMLVSFTAGVVIFLVFRLVVEAVIQAVPGENIYVMALLAIVPHIIGATTALVILLGRER